VLYGHSGLQSLSIECDARAVTDLLKHATVNHTVIELAVPNGWSGRVLLRELQTGSTDHSPLHLSFFAIAGHGAIHLDVPIVLTGEPVGVRLDRGVLDQVVFQLSVVAPSEAIPEAVTIDVSGLGVGDALRVADLVLPAGVAATSSPDVAVVTVLPSKTGADLAAIAVDEEVQPATAQEV
jgi:large subunit ribosomal protein L25